ncbi:putative phosphatidate cytidylytransferase CdsA [Candidatus Protochlamydia naegleriophila]|uniref:Phosphatidate cytidylyltransferase n=1 Tax=Candidatus Protochlamydia naegleriophila TaxID=389348 RepID=A0A0U5JBB3_9BACT|nr:CDP-archaeol synthase [Candidatus Protochlamydia naegleriophila]CUI16084.1 putative phosphatidate cytidylytransferase CdsA [Candidatus Protochlamydia naegleriophila]
MTSHFKQRLIMSSVGIFLIIITIYFSHVPLFTPVFVLINAAIISLALLEYFHLAQHKGFQPLTSLGVGTTTAYVIASFLSIRHPHLAVLPALILLGTAILYFLAFFNKQPNPLGNIAVTWFGIAYLTIPLTCGLQINYFFPPGIADDGRLWLAYALAVTKMTDVGAYICGKILGKNKLAPHISPKKTIEGAIGGLTASLLTSLAFYLFLLSSPIGASMSMSLWQSIWLGLVISILAQFGDLAESILKRDAGVKDSSQLPGLGGVLDIVDSLIFTLPLMYLWLKMHF